MLIRCKDCGWEEPQASDILVCPMCSSNRLRVKAEETLMQYGNMREDVGYHADKHIVMLALVLALFVIVMLAGAAKELGMF